MASIKQIQVGSTLYDIEPNSSVEFVAANLLTAGSGISISANTIAVDSTIATKTYVDTAIGTAIAAAY